MNSEAVNIICKLCKRRIAANHQFIPEHLRPFFFGARLIPIAKKRGGRVRPIAIRDYLPQACQLCHHVQPQGETPWYILPVQFGVGMPGSAEKHSAWNQKPPESETTKTGHWSPWALPMHLTLSAELHSSSKYRTSSPSSSIGVAVLWTAFTLAHQRCKPNPLCLLWGQTR